MIEHSKRWGRRVRLPAILLAALLLTAIGVGIVSALLPAPTVSSITPNTAVQGATIPVVVITGDGFLQGATVVIDREAESFQATNVEVISPTIITCSLALPEWASPGEAWNVYVQNPGSDIGRLFRAFTITPAPMPEITVTAPDGGQRWLQGSSHSITWSTVGTTGSYVKIELLKGTSVNRIISSSTANDGAFSWTVPTTQTPGTDYRIRITSTTTGAYTDTSNAYFSVVAPKIVVIKSGITVTAPNGGEIWRHGTVHTITWSSVGAVGSYVKIELLKGTAVSRIISSSTANDGSFSWTVPATKTLGTDYRIRITSTSNSAYTDSSNMYFRIS